MGNDDINLENVRETVTMIGHAVESVDELTKKIVEARWQFEMVKRNPKLGEVRHPQTGQVVHTYTAKEFASNVAKLTEERTMAIDALLGLTGADSVDSARVNYLSLVTAYQRLGSLRELQNMVNAGFAKAREEAAAQDIIDGPEFTQAIENAKAHLHAVASTLTIPALEVPLIETASTGMFRQ